MSIKHGLMALLTEGPMYGAQLRSEFEHRTGGTWPLNVGQVYTTLERLHRDGLVAADSPADDGTTLYRLTADGVDAIGRWWTAPVERAQAPRSELAIKLALAVTVPSVDVAGIVQAQRTATMSHLQDLTRLKRRSSEEERAWRLVLDNLVFTAEAEIRWLDHVEAQVSSARRVPRKPTPTPRTAVRSSR